MSLTKPAQLIHDIVTNIKPHDELEAAHRQDVLGWTASGAQLFRIGKPDNPAKHLVSYFVLYDKAANKLLLIDHIKAGLLLPTGGHIEQDEDPRTTVMREAQEELDVEADFGTPFGDQPLFVTVTQTKGQGTHTDVSLWYVIGGDSSYTYNYDPGEMRGLHWLAPEEILATDIALLDPYLHRFVRKFLASQTTQATP